MCPYTYLRPATILSNAFRCGVQGLLTALVAGNTAKRSKPQPNSITCIWLSSMLFPGQHDHNLIGISCRSSRAPSLLTGCQLYRRHAHYWHKYSSARCFCSEDETSQAKPRGVTESIDGYQLASVIDSLQKDNNTPAHLETIIEHLVPNLREKEREPLALKTANDELISENTHPA